MAHRKKFFSTLPLSFLLCAGALTPACKTNLDYLYEGSSQGGASAAAGAAGMDASGAKGGSVASSGSGGENGGEAAKIGAGGAAGMDGSTQEPLTDIVSADGRVVATANTFGIDGEWRKFGAATELITTGFTGSDVCIQGKVLAGDWGGGLQLVLHNGAPAAPALAYNASEHRLSGIQLEIEGPDVPSKIRVKFKQIGTTEDYCQDMPAAPGDTLRLTTADAKKDCWMQGGAPVNATQLENFEMHIVPEAGEDISFDFCVKNVSVVPL